MEQSSSIVASSESTGKEIITQLEDISLANLKATGTDKTIYVKAYRKWTPTNKQGKPVLFCCMLINRQGGAIQANVNLREKNKFNAILQTNKTYKISGFGFQDAKTWMQVVPHSLPLVFGTYTDIKDIPDIGFPSHYFNFSHYRDLYSKMDIKEGLLTYYIGCVQYVTELQQSTKATKDSAVWRNIGIQNLDGHTVRFTLWNEDARTFSTEEYEKAEKPVIIAVTSCLVKSYGGLQLSATAATYYYFNPNIQESDEIRSMYEQFFDPPAIINVNRQRFADPQQEKHRNRVTLSDLVNENPQNQQNVRFTVVTTIDYIDTKRPSFFKKCPDCKCKIYERFVHTHCQPPTPENDVTYSYCFRVQLSDGTANVTMTCFSNKANSLLKDCKELVQSMPEQTYYDYPPEILDLQGTKKIFQLHFDPESTKEKRLFILDTSWDDMPLITAGVPPTGESSMDSSKEISAQEPTAMPTETTIASPMTETKTVGPFPPTITAPPEPNAIANTKQTPSTPPTEQTMLPPTSKPTNEPTRKSSRKGLFQETKDASTAEGPKKSKNEK